MSSRMQIFTINCTTKPHPRRGSLYSIVLLNALLVSVIGLSAISLSRIELQMAETKTLSCEADLLAHSAVENAIKQIENNSLWRTTYFNNVETLPVTLNNGTISFKLIDIDGDLADDPNDEVKIIGIGRVGTTAFAHSVDYGPSQIAPYGCLQTGLHSKLALSFNSSTVNSSGILSSDTGVQANAASINGVVESNGNITGAQYNSTTTTGAPNRTEPSNAQFFTEYTSIGTEIPLSNLPYESSSSSYLIDKAILSAGLNTLASSLLDSNAIYFINCQGQNLRIRNSRLVATLVLNNVGNVTLEGSLNWSAHLPNYPVLLVDGSSTFQFENAPLMEASNINFNPAGAPYQGAVDTDTSDSYPSEILGLIYSERDMTFQSSTMTVKGCFVSQKSITLNSTTLTLSYRDTYLNDPPPGFGTASGSLALDPTSWTRTALSP